MLVQTQSFPFPAGGGAHISLGQQFSKTQRTLNFDSTSPFQIIYSNDECGQVFKHVCMKVFKEMFPVKTCKQFKYLREENV